MSVFCFQLALKKEQGIQHNPKERFIVCPSVMVLLPGILMQYVVSLKVISSLRIPGGFPSRISVPFLALL